MNYGICPLSVVPIRSASSDSSEMVSQLLFGEMVEVIGRKGKNWTKVRCAWDNYIGWVDTKQIKAMAYDSQNAGYNTFNTISVRLWTAMPIFGSDIRSN